MRPKSLAVLLLALGCGLVASLGVIEAMSRQNLPDSALDTQPVVVAVGDIPLGEPLTSRVVHVEQWAKDAIPPGAVSRVEDAEGRRARTKLYEGEPILESRLLGKGASEQGATALIPKGYRVVPVKVDLVSGGSSMILPGDRVDVMVHCVKDYGREIPETITQTILQDIKVFAVDDLVDLEHEKDGHTSIAAKTISLLVMPDQAALVMMASKMGDINLVMRSPEDEDHTPNAQARPGQLFSSGGKSERQKETLLPPTDLTSKTQGFLDFLTSMKQKPALPTAGASQSQTWTVRVLKPGEVDDVQFEKDETAVASASPLGQWRPIGAVGNSGGVPVKEETAQAVTQTPEPVGPAPDRLPPPKEAHKSDRDKKDGTTS